MRIYIWLDDVRPIPETWVFQNDILFIPVKSYNDCLTALTAIKSYSTAEEYVTYIDFDHDLGEHLTGYDVAKAIVDMDMKNVYFNVHSANPVGVFNITQLLEHYGYEQFKASDIRVL